MRKEWLRIGQLLPLTLGVLMLLAAATWLHAEPDSTEAVTGNSGPLTEESQQQLFDKFASSLQHATLIGNFTETGADKNELNEERYEIESVEHLQGELWLFKARIRYGENDVSLPLTLPVRWAGDTPVICVDNMGFPGLGTYTARVMIYADHYAGFWSGSDHGGHLFGVIQRNETESK